MEQNLYNIIDLGQHLKLVASDDLLKVSVIPKDSITNVGRHGPIGYINIDEIQSTKLRISQFTFDVYTLIEDVLYDDLDRFINVLASIIKYPPVPSLYNAGPRAFLSTTDEVVYQYGDPTSLITVLYSVEKGIYAISKVLLDGLDIQTTTGSDSGSKDVVLIQDAYKRIFLYVEDSFGLSDLAYLDVFWKPAVYYGVSSLDNDEILSFLAANPVSSLSFDKELNSEEYFQSVFDASGGGRIYILYPESWGDSIESQLNFLGFTDYTLQLTSIEDEFGDSRNYYIWGTNNAQTGDSINVIIDVL